MEFLIYYLIACATTLLACYWHVRRRDATADLPPMPLAATVDPYEIAFMQGGENQLTRVLIVSLAERGYLRATDKGIEPTDKQPVALAPIERTVYEWFSGHRTVEETFKADLSARVGAQCLAYEERLQQERLVRGEPSNGFAWNAWVAGCLVIVGVGGWRALAGLSHGAPIGFLFFIGVFSLAVLGGICSARRLTSRGSAYVKELKAWRHTLGWSTGSSFALGTAVFGMAALSGTSQEQLGKLFGKTSGSSSGGCGACGGDGCGGCGGCGD